MTTIIDNDDNSDDKEERQISMVSVYNKRTESTDLRASDNPMVVDADMESQHRHQFHHSRTASVLHDDTRIFHRRLRWLLLFAGVAPPTSWRSPWIICRFGWPFAVLTWIPCEAFFMYEHFKFGLAPLAYTTSLPALLAYVVALSCCTFIA
jgi:hypothetical protein